MIKQMKGKYSKWMQELDSTSSWKALQDKAKNLDLILTL